MPVAKSTAPPPDCLGDSDGDDVLELEASVPITAASPTSTVSFKSVAHRICTPLSLFHTSTPGSNNAKSSSSSLSSSLLLSSPASLSPSGLETSAALRQRYLNMSSPTTARYSSSTSGGAYGGGLVDVHVAAAAAAARPAEHAAVASPASVPAAAAVHAAGSGSGPGSGPGSFTGATAVQNLEEENPFIPISSLRRAPSTPGLISLPSTQKPNTSNRDQQHECQEEHERPHPVPISHSHSRPRPHPHPHPHPEARPEAHPQPHPCEPQPHTLLHLRSQSSSHPPSTALTHAHGHTPALSHTHPHKHPLPLPPQFPLPLTHPLPRAIRSVAARPSFSCLPPLDISAAQSSSPNFHGSTPGPLRTGSVHTDSAVVHPTPLLRATPQSNNIAIKSPIPDSGSRTVSALSSIAQLEATAERLSTTNSSIDDAIRELHTELKRSDSRRSSVLAASISAASADSISHIQNSPCRARRYPSTSSSSAAIARQRGGYSPATYMMPLQPTDPMTGRMRSGSKASLGRAELDLDSLLSRQGPGKGSVRSVRSARPSLAEISELEPIALNRDAFDRADAAPISHLSNDDRTRGMLTVDSVNMPITDEFHQIFESGSISFSHQSQNQAPMDPRQLQPHQDEIERPATANSTSTYQQAQDAFIDFDGVHCQDHERPLTPGVQPHDQPGAHCPPAEAAAMMMPPHGPDDASMLYYPARVPTMLNLPPKLSNKPKTAARNNRRSQILTAMMDEKKAAETKRRSGVLDLGEKSWLPDPVVDHRDSFAVLSVDELQMVGQATTQAEILTGDALADQGHAATPLRRPRRLTKTDGEKRKSRALNLDQIPAQLRASVFFDLPSTSHDIEIKDGSAMATLDSILDASAHAPVSAFTDHLYTGKLGSETYGKEKKQQHKPGKLHRGNRSHSTHSAERENDGSGGPSVKEEYAPRTSGEGDEETLSGQQESGELVNGLPTTLLAELQLRKQQQKSRLRNPIHHQPTEGMRATLLEMDAVAEVQRRTRQTKRVNLAWEQEEADRNSQQPDDEDVPLAILAAMQNGAKNMADVDRPLGLMEIRQMEDNEPLRNRQARLQGRGVALNQAKRASVFTLPATRLAEVQPPAGIPPIILASPDPSEEDHEGETLGQRKKRLAETVLPQARPVSGAFSAELLSQFGDRDEPRGGMMGGMMGGKLGVLRGENVSPPGGGEEETLGQRRRRLQMEREAREREMSYSNLIGGPVALQPAMQPAPQMSVAEIIANQRRGELDPQTQQVMRMQMEQQRISLQEAQMAAVRAQMPTALSGPEGLHHGGFRGGVYNDCSGGVFADEDLQRLKDFDPQADQKRLMQEFNKVAGQDAKMASIRSQMPTALAGPDVGRAGGFRGGMYNDGTGGLVLEATRPGTNPFDGQAMMMNQGAIPRKRASMMMMSTHSGGMPMRDLNHRQSFYSLSGIQQTMNQGNSHANYQGTYQPGYFGGSMPSGLTAGAMATTMSTSSMDRVERWRHSVMP